MINAFPAHTGAGIERKREKMKKVDDRTDEQKKTHVWGVVAKDKFMSGWGGAEGGASRCSWACGPGVDIERVYRQIPLLC